MKPTHIIHDQDNHFKLDPVTRTWTNATAQKPILIQGDHNSEVFTFELPLRIEGHLMSECDAVQVHYINIDTVTRAQSRGVYEVEDLQVNPDGSETITCSWVISRNATKYVGSLSFLLRFSCVQEDGTEYYVWHSAIDNSSVVSKGISNGDTIAEAYPDILAQWYQEIEKWKAETGNGSLAGVDWLATKEVIQEGSVVFPEVTKSFDGAMQFLSGVQMEIDPGLYYDVNWNGKIYTRQALVYDGETYLGNGRVVFGSAAGDLPDTGEPFGIVYNGGANLMLKKANTATESIKLSISTAGEYRYNKMPKEYLPVGLSNIVAFTAAELRAMSCEEFAAAVGEREFIIVEYERPISQGGMLSYKSNPVLLAKDRLGDYVGCAHDWYDVGLGYIIRLIAYNGNVSLAVTPYRAVAFPTSTTIDVGAYPVWTGEYWDFEVPKMELPTLMLPAEQLTDGAVISVSAETYMDLMQKIQMSYTLTIVTEVSGGLAMLPVLCMTAPLVGYPATVKCFSPTTGEIITITLIPSA